MTIFVRSLLGLLGLSVSCCSVVVPVSMQAGSKISRNTRSVPGSLQTSRGGQGESTVSSHASQSGSTFDNLWETIKSGFNSNHLLESGQDAGFPISSEFQNIIQSSPGRSNWSVVVQEGNNCPLIRPPSKNICGYLHLKENQSGNYKLRITYDGNQWKAKVVRLKASGSNAEYGNLTQHQGVNKDKNSFQFENLRLTSKDLGDDIQESIRVSLSQGK